MVITKYNFKRLFKNKLNWIWFIVLPCILSMVMIQSTLISNKYRIGIVDEDQTVFSKGLIDKIDEMSDVSFIERDEIKDHVLNSKIDYGIVIEKGLTESLMNGKSDSIKGYSIKESNVSVPIKFKIQSYLSAVIKIGEVTNNETQFYEGIEKYNQGLLSSEYTDIDDGEDSKAKSNLIFSMGIVAMSIILLMTFSTTLIIKDKDTGMYRRIFSCPVKKAEYKAQHLISYFLVSVVQLVVLLNLVGVLLDINISQYFLGLFIIFCFYSWACVSIGIAITSISSNTKQANAMISIIVIPMCMLGGCLWDRNIMPSTLQKISNFVPTKWVITGAEKIILGGSIVDILPHIGVLLLFSVLFFIISTTIKDESLN